MAEMWQLFWLTDPVDGEDKLVWVQAGTGAIRGLSPADAAFLGRHDRQRLLAATGVTVPPKSKRLVFG